MERQTDTLNKILTSQVLLLAARLKEERAERGVRSTSDFISEAVREIGRKQAEILRLIQQQQ